MGTSGRRRTLLAKMGWNGWKLVSADCESMRGGVVAGRATSDCSMSFDRPAGLYRYDVEPCLVIRGKKEDHASKLHLPAPR
jgi:hypothetical protein